MSRSDAERVADILAACSRLAEIVELGREEFDRNWLAVSAASYELAVVGEAIAHLSDEFVEMHDSVPTRKAKSLRNLLMHEYFRAEPEILWDTRHRDARFRRCRPGVGWCRSRMLRTLRSAQPIRTPLRAGR